MKQRADLFRQASFAAVVAAISILCACNPAPKYARPPAQAPAAFKEAAPEQYKEGQGWKIAQPGDDKLRGKWWQIYNDEKLSALEDQVQTQNQSIAQAEATFRQARALVVSARSQLYPTLSASPSYSNSHSSSTTRGSVLIGNSGGTSVSSSSTSSTGSTSGATTTGSTSSSTGAVSGTGNSGIYNQFAFPLDVSYEVDLWHRVRNSIAQNEFSAQASAADLGTALLSTQAELAQDYFEVRALDAERKILEDTVENYRRSLQLTTTLYEAGIDSEEDVALAKTQLDTATAQETDLGVSRSTFEHAIAVLIGKPPATFELAVAPFRPNPPEVPLALPSEILERRPDIAAAERRVAASNAAIGVAKAAYYPNVTLSAIAGFQTSNFAQWFSWPSHFWSVGPALSQILFDGGARRAATEQAQASYDAAVASYRGTVLSAFQAVEDQLSTLTILAKEAKQEHTAVQSAGHYLDLALTRYKTGVDSYLNVITAQTSVLTNRETELQIQLRQMTASVSLVMALGGGWDSSQLPQMKDLIARPAAWKPAPETALPPAGPDAAPNPPALSQ